MKGQKRNISALFALLLAGVLLTSARANSKNIIESSFDEDFSYLEEVEEYVDNWIEEYTSDDFEEDAIESVKIYDEDGELIHEEDLDEELSEEVLRLIRQSDYLTEYDNTTYYRLNS